MKKKQIDIEGNVSFIYKEPYFNCKIFTINNKYEIMKALDRADEEINNGTATWLSEGSGWVVEEVQHHYVNIVKYLPLRGSSYLPLPKELRNSMHGIINLKNEDNKCAIWCLGRHLNPQKNHPERITASDYEFMKKLDLGGIEFPLTINKIPKIEKQNNININVFGYDDQQKSLYPIYVSKAENPDHIELLYIEGNYKDEERQRYVYIKDFSRLMFNFTKHKERKHFCMNCLQCFYSKESLAKHRANCIVINGVQAVEMPKPYIDKNGVERIPSVYFRDHHKQLPVPFVIIADFECFTEKISGCQPSSNKSYTEKYQRHTPCSFGYKVVCQIYRGEDCINKFVKSMFNEVKNCQDVIRENFNKPLKMTAKDECNFKKATGAIFAIKNTKKMKKE